MPRFFINNGNGWNETELRPSASAMRVLEQDAKEKAAEAVKHEPGMGWHYVPCEDPEFVLSQTWYGSEYWWVCWPTSEGAILAQTAIFCKAHGLDFIKLQRMAYPDQEPYEPTEEDYDNLLPRLVPTLQDVLDDLSDVNYHSLCTVVEEATQGKEAQ